jgi:hypothetical protein
LARCAADYDIDTTRTDSCDPTNFCSRQSLDRPWDDCTFGKIELVNGSMDRVDLDRGHNVEACLLETEAEPARASEQINASRPRHALRPPASRRRQFWHMSYELSRTKRELY